MRAIVMRAAIGASLWVLLSGPSIGQAALDETSFRTSPRLLVTGDRIRLTPRDGSQRVIGMVQAAAADTLWFTAESGDRHGSRTVSWRSLRMAELSVGKHGHAVGGLFIGLAAGVGIGLLATSGGHERSGDPWADFGNSLGDAMSEAIAVLLCGVGGLAAGALIGGEIKSDRWEPVAMPSPPEPTAGKAAPPDTLRTE